MLSLPILFFQLAIALSFWVITETVSRRTHGEVSSRVSNFGIYAVFWLWNTETLFFVYWSWTLMMIQSANIGFWSGWFVTRNSKKSLAMFDPLVAQSPSAREYSGSIFLICHAIAFPIATYWIMGIVPLIMAVPSLVGIALGLGAADDWFVDQPSLRANRQTLMPYKDLPGADLSGANLWGANLWDANLNGANLSGANLSGEDLIRRNLTGANLSGANLCDANLTDANLNGANLSGANLSGANLRDANLKHANLTHAILWDANLSGAILRDAKLTDANLTHANLAGATMPDGSIHD